MNLICFLDQEKFGASCVEKNEMKPSLKQSYLSLVQISLLIMSNSIIIFLFHCNTIMRTITLARI